MIVKRGSRAYQVRVAPFPARTVQTRAAAERLELELKLRKSMGDLYEEPETTLGDELDRYLERKRATGGRKGKLSARTIEFYERNARFWEPFRATRVSRLRRAPLEDAITVRAAEHPRSARNELEHLKAVLRAAEARGQRVDQMVYGIDPVRHDEREGVALTLEQLDELASFFPDQLQRLVPLAGLVGARLSEWLTLTDDRVDLKAQEMRVPRTLNKSRREKVIQLTRHETQLLREQLLARPAGTRLVFAKPRSRTPWDRHAFRERVWVKATLASGLGELVEGTDGKLHYEGLVFHDLRHTATSLMCRAGMRPEWVAERRGDADGGVLVLKRYRHLYPAEMTTAIEALESFVTRSRDDQADVSQA